MPTSIKRPKHLGPPDELTREGKHNPLDKAKAIIKANEEENPELALELSELLERKLQDAKISTQRRAPKRKNYE